MKEGGEGNVRGFEVEREEMESKSVKGKGEWEWMDSQTFWETLPSLKNVISWNKEYWNTKLSDTNKFKHNVLPF